MCPVKRPRARVDRYVDARRAERCRALVFSVSAIRTLRVHPRLWGTDDEDGGLIRILR